MKILNSVFIVCLFALPAAAQSITESKDHTNSILLNGSAITFKITDPSLKLDLQKTALFKNNRNNGYIAGISAQGENETGVAGIFNGGDLVPAGRITALAGLTFSNNVDQNAQRERDRLKNKEKDIREQLAKFTLIKDQLKKAGQDTTAVKNMITDLTERELKPVLLEGVKAAGKNSAIPFQKTTAFAFGGMAAKTFKHFIGYDATNLLNSFVDENFRGGFGGIGVNHQYRNLQFGATFTYTKDDNQSLLSQKTYEYQKVTTVGSQTVVESAEIKAFGGDYASASYFSLNIDFIANLPLDPVTTVSQPRNYMFINPYLHSKIGSNNKDLLPNTTDVGMGLYVFNNKSMLLGGIFIEVPDVSNNIEKSKVAADRNIRPGLQKLSFGIVTRFNLQSFLKLQDL